MVGVVSMPVSVWRVTVTAPAPALPTTCSGEGFRSTASVPDGHVLMAVEGDFSVLKFSLANAAKDVRYYNQVVLDSGLTAPMTAATMQTMQTAINIGFGTPEHLVGSLVPAQAKLNNVEFPPEQRR